MGSRTVRHKPGYDRLFDMVAMMPQPVQMRDAIQAGEDSGMHPRDVRRWLWTAIDEHRFTLGLDNSLSLTVNTTDAGPRGNERSEG